MAVVYDEVGGSPSEETNVDYEAGRITGSATRIFNCAWADRYDVRDALLLGAATRTYEYDSNLIAKKASIKPVGNRATPNDALNHKVDYEKAEITVQYESLDAYEADSTSGTNYTGADLCEQEVTIDTQYLQLSSGKFYWNISAPRKMLHEGQTPERLFAIKHYKITLHNFTTLPVEFDSLIGTINTTSYKLVHEIIADKNGTHEFDRLYTRNGNLLYLGYSINRSITGFGTAGWNLVLNFDEVMNGTTENAWNHFYNPDTQTFVPIYDEAGNIVDIYEPADWTKLALPPHRT